MIPLPLAKTVIVVEIDATLRQFLGRLLSRTAERVVLAESTAEIIDTVADDDGSVVVYNTYAGWEPLSLLRESCPHVPIVVLLSPSASVNQDLASIVRPVATLSIPFRPDDLEEAVMRAAAEINRRNTDAS